MNQPYIILVDYNDTETGIMDKMEVHRKGFLHRAISVFIVNTNGEWLLHRRAIDKYHSSGLWTNASCSHPYPAETNLEAARRRLKEEMGMSCPLNELFSFMYKEKLDNELTEHEYDHVFLGISDEKPEINTKEVMDWKYIAYNDLINDIEKNPLEFTVWFKKIVEKVNSHSMIAQTEMK